MPILKKSREPWHTPYSTFTSTTTEIPMTMEEMIEETLNTIEIEYIERYLRKKKLNNIEKKDVL